MLDTPVRPTSDRPGEGKLMKLYRLALLTVVLLLIPERQFFAQEVKERATLKGHTGPVLSVAFSPDGKTLASGTGEHNVSGAVNLWVVATGKEKATLQGHTKTVYSVAFSPDGKTLVSVSGDGTMKLWDVPLGKELVTVQVHTFAVLSVAFSPDGKTLASGGADETMKLWDVATGKE